MTAPAYVHKFYIFIGAMQQGKSFFANQLLQQYAAKGWAGLVYNLGRPTDFSAAEKIKLLSYQDHLAMCQTKEQRQAYKENPFLSYYKDAKGNLKEWEQANFAPPAGLAGKAVKMVGADSLTERLFFDVIYNYISNAFIILDDIRAAFAHGLKQEFRLLFSRINHAGAESPAASTRGKGVSIAILLHSLSDLVNVDGLLTYVTHIVNFKTMRPPDLSILKKDEVLKDHFSKSYNYLVNAPKYSHTITDIFGDVTQAKTPESDYFLI